MNCSAGNRVIVGVLSVVLVLAILEGAAASQNAGQGGSAAISGHVTVGGKGAGGIVVMLTKIPVDEQKAIQQLLSEGLGGSHTTTDIDGSYRFSGLQSGRYSVYPFAPSSSSKKGFGQGTEVTVNDGESVGGIDFSMERGGVITGKVTGPDGRPVIGAFVYAVAENGSSNNMQMVSMVLTGMRSRMTDDRGIYRIYGLEPGKYTIGVSQTVSPLVPSKDSRSTYYPGVTDVASAGKVDVTAGGETGGIDIKVTPSSSTTYRASGRVVDESGNPIAGVRVVYGASTDQGKSVSESDGGGADISVSNVPVTTNSAGEFHIQGLRNGTYRASVFSGFGTDAEGYSDPASFDIKDSDASGIEIRMHPGGTVTGTVVLDGTTDADVMAKLSQEQVSGMVFSPSSQSMGFNRSAIGSDGSFTLHGLPPGQVQISLGAVFELGSPDPFKVIRVEQDGAPVRNGVKLDPGQQVTGVRVIVAYANCSISGSVTVQGGKLPIGTGLTVNAMAAASDSDAVSSEWKSGAVFGGGGTAEVDASGQFQITNLAPGSYMVSVDVNGPAWTNLAKRPRASKIISVTSGSEAHVDLILDLSSDTTQKDKQN